MQVGRNAEPETDANLLAAISAATDSKFAIRADANRLWTLGEALRFAARLSELNCSLEYVEEPVNDPQQIEQFVRATGLAVAVDESLDDGTFMLRAAQQSTQHADDSKACVPVCAVSAVVIKPSLLGSLEQTCELLRWGADHGVKCVISSSFESPVGLAAIGSIAAAADALYSERNPNNTHATVPTTHGLGTLSWFQSSPDDVIPTSWLPVHSSTAAPASMLVSDMHAVHQHVSRMHALKASPPHPASPALPAPPTSSVLSCMSPAVNTLEMDVQSQAGFTANVRMLHIGVQGSVPKTPHASEGVLLFLHGFMGAAEDWVPVMHGMAACGYQCYAMDLPGHSHSHWVKNSNLNPGQNESSSVSKCKPCMTDYASVVLQVTDRLGADNACSVGIVGYSLGARIALEASAACEEQGVNVRQVVAVSASPGIRWASAALDRCRSDACTASLLRSMRSTRATASRKSSRSSAMTDFLESWYSTPLWASLRQHPRYSELVSRRACEGDPRKLADVLEQCSSGRQNLWPEVLDKGFGCKVSFVVGGLDSKFLKITERMVSSSASSVQHAAAEEAVGVCASTGVKSWSQALPYSVAEVKHAGHAVHEEQPAALVSALQHLLQPEE